MDTNDYRPTEGTDTGGQYENQIAPNPVYTQPGGYIPQGQPGPKRSKQKNGKGRGVLIAIIMVLCLAVGGLLAVYVIVPAIEGERGQDEIAISDTLETQADEPQTTDADTALATPEATIAQPPETTNDPAIGGVAPNIDASENPIVQIAQEVGPAVVGVAVSQTGAQNVPLTDDQVSGYGTGIILTEDGYIVTNNHVITGASAVKVALMDGTEYPATIVGADATTDLAVIKIDASGLTVAALGSSDSLLVGETVVAIGNPLGSDLAGSVTSGIVSALNREISTNGYSQRYIQTDAAINPGNSGGALVNIRGEVIGINTLKSYLAGYDDYGVPIGTEGIGFAIPINAAKPIIEQLMKEGKVERPGIGISCLVDVTNAYNVEGAPDGITVVDVVAGGPAEEAGLQIGDVITAIDGVTVTTVDELTTKIKTYSIGDEVNLTVWREGSEYSAKVTIGDLNQM